VCEEREMQIKLKKERQAASDRADKALVAQTISKNKDLEQEELDLQLLNRLQRVRLAQNHIQQAKQRRLQVYEEKKVPQLPLILARF
jgi:hypothetical protein